MNAHFRNAFAHRPAVAEVPKLGRRESPQDVRLAGIVTQSPQPPGKDGGLNQGVHGCLYPTGYDLSSHGCKPGGAKSDIAGKLDGHFTQLGWIEKQFDTRIVVDKVEYHAPTHKVDCYKNRVALEVEWNNKDPFYDRDLNNFRLLFDLRAIDAGVIVTRSSPLQAIFNALGKGASYGNSTTHLDKLVPRLEGGGGGGCPVVAFGIKAEAYIDDGPAQ
jgi:Restriction endonuclease BglII